jgi:hypothetical protein
MEHKMMMAVMIGVMALSMTSCGHKQDNGDIIAPKEQPKRPAPPVSMQDYKQARDVSWMGMKYKVIVERQADDSLTIVKDENGQKFVDNRITLRILRSDGTVFFCKSFTKASFESCLDNDYEKTGILEGLVFDRVDGHELRFAASVSHPQTDEYIPMVLTVNNQGSISISRDTHLDTSAPSDEEEVDDQQ